MAPNCLLLSVCVLDDAGKGVSALHGGSGDHVAEAVAAYEGEKHGLPGHHHLECVKAGADEGEALRQRLLYLTEPAQVAGGDGYPDLTAGGGPVSREGSIGSV